MSVFCIRFVAIGAETASIRTYDKATRHCDAIARPPKYLLQPCHGASASVTSHAYMMTPNILLNSNGKCLRMEI